MSGNGRKAHETRRASEKLVHRRQEAQAAFIRAAAVLTDIGTPQNVGEASFWAALGLMRLAQSDPGEEALSHAEAIIRSMTVPATAGEGVKP